MLRIHNMGTKTTIPDWPENTIEGLFGALERWPLDPTLDFSKDPELDHDPLIKPFRGRAWCGVQRMQNPNGPGIRYVATRPIYPESPNAVSYLGNFLEMSWVFSFETDDPELIARLDAAIARNMQMPAYIEADRKILKRIADVRKARTYQAARGALGSRTYASL